MNKFCYQGNEHDCGFACLKMLLATISKKNNFLYLPHPKETGYDYSFLDLIENAGTYHVGLSAYEMKFSELAKQTMPLMVKVTGNHMVLLTKVKKGKYYYNDPAVGKCQMNEAKFQQMYSGFVLMAEDYSEMIIPSIEKPVLVNKTYNIVHLLISVIMVATILIGFYFTKNDANIIWAMMFISAIIFIELFENWFLLKSSDEFDDRFIPLFFRDKEHQNYSSYAKYLETKSSLFTLTKSAVVLGALSLVLSVIMIINDYKSLIIIFILSIYKIVELLFFGKKDLKTERKISELETSIFQRDSLEVDELKKMNKSANLHVLTLTSRSCMFNFVIMALVVLMMFINGQISVNYAVFHYGVYFVIGQGLDSLFMFFKNKVKTGRNLAEFFNNCNL